MERWRVRERERWGEECVCKCVSKVGLRKRGHAVWEMGAEGEPEARAMQCDRPGGARLRRVWNSTDVHHAARMGWGVGGRARRGKVGHGWACKEVLSRIESSAEEKLEERRGAAGPGLIARSAVDRTAVGRWSAAGGQHTRQSTAVTAWAYNTQGGA